MKGAIVLAFLAVIAYVAASGLSHGDSCTHTGHFVQDDASCGVGNNMLCGEAKKCVCADAYLAEDHNDSAEKHQHDYHGKKFKVADDKKSCEAH